MTGEQGSTVRILEEDVARSGLYRGVVVEALTDDEVVCRYALGVDGIGELVTHSSLFALYCTAKPLLALSIAVLVDQGIIELDRPMGEVVRTLRAVPVGTLSPRLLLCHAAGVHELRSDFMAMLPPALRAEQVRRLQPAVEEAGSVKAFSEYASWHLLADLVEAATGEAWPDVVRARVLKPMCLDRDIFVRMTAAEYAANRDRIAVQAARHDGRWLPVLWERSPRVCTEGNPAFGSYGTMRALALFYKELVRVLRGESSCLALRPATLSEFLEPARPASHDPVLRRVCTFGLGWMVDLKQHSFGRGSSPRSFGHSGWRGTSWAFSDPDDGLCVACGFIGCGTSDAPVRIRRPLILQAIRADGARAE